MADPAPNEFAAADSSSSDVNPSADVLARRLQWTRIGVLVLLSVTISAAYLTRHCLAAAKTKMQAEVGFNDEQFGYMYAAFSLGYFICQVPGGWMGKYLGTRFTLALLCCLWSLMTLLTGFANSFVALVAVRLGYGLAQAGMVPVQAQILKDWFPESTRGSASAVVVTAMSAGGFAAFWLTSQLMEDYHWRTVLIGYSVFGIVWSLFFFMVFRSQPYQAQWLKLEAPVEPTTATLPGKVEDSTADDATPTGYWTLMVSASFWGLMIQGFFKAAGYNLLVTFFPTYLEIAHKMSPERAAELASWPMVAVLFGSIPAGWVIDQLQRRTGSKRISRTGPAVVSMLLTAAIMFAATYATSGRQAAILIAVSSLVMAIATPCVWAATIDIGGKNSGVVMGLLNMGSTISGVAISPLVGRLVDHIKATNGDWNLVIHVHALFYFVAGLSWLMVTFKHAPNSEETTHAD